MSFHDQHIGNQVANGEAPFQLNECFFSRTDERGIIQAGNYLFKRIAGLEWDELQGAPHKTVRHPDMPKGVFWLLWDTIKRGRSIGAYVKNRTKNGLYYWVYAMVVPCEGGYLSARLGSARLGSARLGSARFGSVRFGSVRFGSVRFKPSSPLLATIQTEYAALLKAEQTENLTPEDSAKRFLARLKEMGFEKYHHFAAHAASEELLARDAGLKLEQDPTIANMRKMLFNAQTLKQESEGQVHEFQAMRTIPHNLRVIASRIEPAGGPVTVLSQNYSTMSESMSQWFEAHVLGEKSNFASINGTVNNCLFAECMVLIIRECGKLCSAEEQSLGNQDPDAERKILNRVSEDRIAEAYAGLQDVKIEAERILQACSVMHRHFLGLSSTRVLCKIESARLPDTGETLTDIIDQLADFQSRISAKLDHIVQLSNEIRSQDFIIRRAG